jgi:alkylation response protein AidB-like acyl-CoA dehydrogenase
METRTHAARLAYYHAAAKMLAGEPFKKEAAIAKLVASNSAMDNARGCNPDLQWLRLRERVPGRPVLSRREDPRNRRGTFEIQRMLIARELVRTRESPILGHSHEQAAVTGR